MDAESLLTPRTYYDAAGPLAQVFQAMRTVRKLGHVGVMGLGTGCTTCYQEPGQRMTFFEIDPTIERIARDPKLFRYLELQGQDVEVIIGDGRQNVSRAPEGTFDLLILDAFSSDAIPVHLLTREALANYLQKLLCDHLFHISTATSSLSRSYNLLDAGGALIESTNPPARMRPRWAPRPRRGSR
jgi:spermidine synthase